MSYLFILFPNIAYADTPKLDAFLTKVNAQIVNPLISFVFALAVVYFLYGVLKFLMNMDNEGARDEGKKHMLWGIIGITIMIGVWGILSVITNTLNLDYINEDDLKNNTVNLPN